MKVEVYTVIEGNERGAGSGNVESIGVKGGSGCFESINRSVIMAWGRSKHTDDLNVGHFEKLIMDLCEKWTICCEIRMVSCIASGEYCYDGEEKKMED